MPRRDPNPVLDAIMARQPGFWDAVLADAKVASAFRGEQFQPRNRLEAAARIARLAYRTDAHLALVAYRLRVACNVRRIPVLPRLLHWVSMATAQVCIGDPVVVHPGVRVPHGQIVVDGTVEVHPGVAIRPWVTIGLRAGDFQGPTIERGVSIGTGAKIIGPVTVGAHAVVGANAVVVRDVEPRTTVVGIPARPRPAADG